MVLRLPYVNSTIRKKIILLMVVENFKIHTKTCVLEELKI